MIDAPSHSRWGAIFVSFKAKVIAHALENYARRPKGDFYYPDDFYRKMGIPITLIS